MLKINYIDKFEYVRTKLNDKLNIARENFTKNKNEENKEEYLKLLDDMRKLNLFDKNIIDKYM